MCVHKAIIVGLRGRALNGAQQLMHGRGGGGGGGGRP